jgi:hypothetical protein
MILKAVNPSEQCFVRVAHVFGAHFLWSALRVETMPLQPLTPPKAWQGGTEIAYDVEEYDATACSWAITELRRGAERRGGDAR